MSTTATDGPRMTIGYIGLGHLGNYLAASLQRAGHQLVINDLTGRWVLGLSKTVQRGQTLLLS
jgi:3-hydroxyisobutyrate dehydrogenase-like beta-hydroxyacid dehydrogenase